jgi:hypothetical protein
MMYPSQDALGSRLGCILQCNTEGDPNTCRALSKQNLREAHTSNCRAGSRGLWISTLSAAQPKWRCANRVTKVYTPASSPTNGSQSQRSRPQSRKRLSVMSLISVSVSSPSSSKCMRLPVLIRESLWMRMEKLYRSIYSMRRQPLPFHQWNSRPFQAMAKLVGATNTSSGTR